MKRLHTIVLLSGILFWSVCYGQADTTVRGYHDTWVVKPIPDLNSFLKFNELELKLDSMENSLWLQLDSARSRGDSSKAPDGSGKQMLFKDNRGRMYVDFYKDGRLETGGDSLLRSGFGTRCYCMMNKDTVFIKMVMGFFGGFGFDIAIFENKFRSSYFSYADDALLYKISTADTVFRRSFMLPNKEQYLILKNKPSFKNGQQLTGYLVFTSADYYEGDGNNNSVPVKMYVTGKLYFACNVREIINSAGR